MDINKEELVNSADAELLDSQIDQITDSFIEEHFLDNDEAEQLEMLVAKSMKLGELYERKKWQEKATPDGFVLDAPARVGGGVFREGVKWKTVIESAQRLYEHSKDEIKPIVSPADMLKIACGDLVLVPKEKIGSLVNELNTAFQSTPTLTLGELLPLQQDFQAMIEAQEQK